jgi:hypothetical protein
VYTKAAHPDHEQPNRGNWGLQLLLVFHIGVCCLSLIDVSFLYPQYHIFFDQSRLLTAVVIVAAFGALSTMFVRATFSFGYFVGFYFYTMAAGYLWLNCFSEFNYNHLLAGLSAISSSLVFLLPALFVNAPLRQFFTPSLVAFDRVLNGIVFFAALVLAIGAAYSFKPIGLARMIALDSDIYSIRETLGFPTALNYLLGLTTNALLPFAFAGFLERRRPYRAALAALLLLLFYPITLSKLVMLSSVWIVGIAMIARWLEARKIVVLSLLLPTCVGVVLFAIYRTGQGPSFTVPYFSLVNFRLIAIPSLALDYYNEYFSKNPTTHFCQIQLLKYLMSCPYDQPIATVIYNAFGIGGYFNASLFATEGIASVGVMFAPASAFACGLLVALANRLSAGLPPRLVLTSGAILVQVMLNVPLTISLLTNGGALLFLLWYFTPRSISERVQTAALRDQNI